MTNYESPQPIQPGPDTDDNGVPAPRSRGERLRARLSRFYFEDRVAPVTPSELRELEGSGHH